MGKITDRNAELAIRKMIEDRKPLAEVLKKYKLEKFEDSNRINKMIRSVLKKNRLAVNDYRKGEDKALHFLVGEVMREARGQVDANEVRKTILKLIK